MQTQGVLNYLSSKGIIDSVFETNLLHKNITHHDIKNYKCIKAVEGGLYEWFVSPGDKFDAGETIGQYIQTSTMQKKNLILPYGGVVISILNKGSICQGTQIFNIAITK
jgi:predicted deacylase